MSIRLDLGSVRSMCIVKLTFMALKQLLKGGELLFEIAPSTALPQSRSYRHHQIQPGGMMFRGKHSPAQLWMVQRHITATFSLHWDYVRPTGLCQRSGEAEFHSLPITSTPDEGGDTLSAMGMEWVGRRGKKLNGGICKYKRLMAALFSLPWCRQKKLCAFI